MPASQQVVVQLTGGLGNQMFQYSAGLSLSRRLGTRLILDVRALHRHAKSRRVTPHSLELNSLAIAAPVAADADLRRLGLGWTVLPSSSRFVPNPVWSVAQWHFGAMLKQEPVVYREPTLDYDPSWPDFEEAGRDVYLIGYWQSENYFSNVRDLLRREFRPKSIPQHMVELRAVIAGQKSLCIHVRRGDYLRNRRTRRFHGVLDGEYYQRAASVVLSRTQVDATFIFTEDGDLGDLDTRKLINPHVVSGLDTRADSSANMFAMSGGSAFVVANSSFSWWGAWLSDASPTHIVAPTPWRPSVPTSRGPVPDSWSTVRV